MQKNIEVLNKEMENKYVKKIITGSLVVAMVTSNTIGVECMENVVQTEFTKKDKIIEFNEESKNQVSNDINGVSKEEKEEYTTKQTKNTEQIVNVVEVSNEKELIDAIKDNANIKLTSNITLTTNLDIRKKNITIDGANFKIIVDSSVTKNPLVVRGINNTIKNLTIENCKTIGIMGYNSKNLTLENLTLNGIKGISAAGVDLSGCENATLENITTSNHKQAGIRIKNKSSVTFKGSNKHINEVNPLVVVDSESKFTDVDYAQYMLEKENKGQKIYYMKEKIDVNSQESLEKAITVPNVIINITGNFAINKEITINSKSTGITINGGKFTIDCSNGKGKLTVKGANTKIYSLRFKNYLNAGLVVYGAKNVELSNITLEGNSITLSDGTLRPKDERSKVGLDIANKSTVVLNGITSINHSQKGIFVRGASNVTIKSKIKHFNDTVHIQLVKANNEAENTINFDSGIQYTKESATKDEKGREITNYYTKEVIQINSAEEFIANSRNCGTVLSLNNNITFNNDMLDKLKKLDPHPYPQYENVKGFERDLGLNILQNITIQGNNHTIDLNGICGLVIKGNNNDVKNVKIINSVGNGISVYNSKDVKLNEVTVENNKKSGIVANGSFVDVINCKTINNGECGVMATRSRTLDNPDNPNAYRDSVINIKGTFEQQEPNKALIIRNLEMIKSNHKQDNKICFKSQDKTIEDSYKHIKTPEVKAKLSLMNQMIFKEWFETHGISFDTEFQTTDENIIKKQTKIDVTKPNESNIVLDNTGKVDNTENFKKLLKYAALNSKELYFPEGNYKISQDIDLTQLNTSSFSNVTITGDANGLSVIDGSSNNKMLLIKNNDYHANMNYVNINNMTFDNVGIEINGVYKSDISLNDNIFMNGKYTYENGKITMMPYITANNSTYTIERNIFLRGKEYAGRGISTYGTKNTLIKDNFFGNLEGKNDASTMLPNKVIDRLNLIDKTRSVSKEQGNFFTCINNERYDNNMTIENNYINMNDSREIEGIPKNALISGIDVSKEGQRKDHIIYSKSYNGLNIVGNYFKGMGNDSSGGVKLRNGVGAYIGANYFKDVPLLTYIYKDLTKAELKLYDTTIYNNLFHETKNIGKEGTGILYYQNFKNGDTLNLPDGETVNNVKGDVKNFVVYNNKFLAGEDSVMTMSNRAKDFKNQFYMNANVYEENGQSVNYNKSNMIIKDSSVELVKSKLNSGYDIYSGAKIPLYPAKVDKTQLSKEVTDTKAYLESIKDKIGDKEGQYSKVIAKEIVKLLDEAKSLLQDANATQWNINNNISKTNKLIEKLKRDINVDGDMGVTPIGN